MDVILQNNCAICKGRKPTHRPKYCGAACAKKGKALWKKRNPVKVARYQSRWYEKNRQAAKDEYIRWCEANPDKCIRKRIARKMLKI